MTREIYKAYQNELDGKNQGDWSTAGLQYDREVYVYAWDEKEGRLAKYGQVNANEPLKKMGKMQDKLAETLKDSSQRLKGTDWYGSHNVEYMLKNMGESVKELWNENQRIKEKINSDMSRKSQAKSDDFYRRTAKGSTFHGIPEVPGKDGLRPSWHL